MDKFKILAALPVIFACLSFFFALTSWVFDDSGHGSGGSGLGDMFMAQSREHRAWSGKFIGHFMAGVLLHGPAWLHPVLSPLVFTGPVFCGVVLTLGSCWRSRRGPAQRGVQAGTLTASHSASPENG